MRILVTWGSKRGGTEGIGRILAEALQRHAHEVVAVSADEVKALAGFDAVIVGGALYANRWPSNVRRFVKRNVAQLRKVPVWFFSSGPLDDSAERADIPAPREVAILAERVGAKRHITFGGRLAADAKGFPASAMARTHAGDWRNAGRIRSCADVIASELPGAAPGAWIEHPAHGLPRLLLYGVAGWGACAAAMAGLLALGSVSAAVVVHAVLAPLVFAALAWHYFRGRGARDPLPTAITWTGIVVLLDLLVVAAAVQRSFAMFASFAGTWLPLALVFLATWAIGGAMATMPWPRPPRAAARPRGMTGKVAAGRS